MIFSRAKGQSRGFIFTKRTQSERGVLSFTLAVLSFVTGIMAIYKAFKNMGEVSSRLGATGVVAMLFAAMGLIMGIVSMREPDTFKIFPLLGLIFSVLSLVVWGFILYVGIG